MPDSDEDTVVSTISSYGLGEDIFGKYDPDKLVEGDSIDYPLTKMKKMKTNKMPKKKTETNKENEEEDIPKRKKKHKIALKKDTVHRKIMTTTSLYSM